MAVSGLNHGPCEGLNGASHTLHPHRQDLVPDKTIADAVRQRITHYVNKSRYIYQQIEVMLSLVDFPNVITEESQIRNVMRDVKGNRSTAVFLMLQLRNHKSATSCGTSRAIEAQRSTNAVAYSRDVGTTT
jgi:hypothetical protein